MNPDKFLLVKGRGGLGDRMKCVVTAILYARLTGRKLIVDWSDPLYSNAGTNAFHCFFQCSLCNATDEIPASDSVSPAIWRGHLHESFYYMEEHYGSGPFSIDIKRLDHQETVLVLGCEKHSRLSDLLRSYSQGELGEFAQVSKNEALRKLLRQDLTLHPQLQRRVDQIKKRFASKKTVGLHVRYTDHRTSIWSVLKQLNALLKREPDLQIFLSTDNLQIKKMFEAGYSGVITTPHWYASTPGLPIHKDRSRPDAMESGSEALVDLYLLAECDYLVVDKSSSFSEIAAALTRASGSNVFDVKRKSEETQRAKKAVYRLWLRTGLFSWGLAILRWLIKMRQINLIAR